MDLNKKSMYILLKWMNANIPFFPIQFFNYYFLEYQGFPQKQKIRFDGNIAIADKDDLRELKQVFKVKAQKFEKRFNDGHLIILARETDGRIVGYENLDLSPAHHEDHSGILIDIPQNSIYLYDAYILPEYRMRGLWIGFKNLISDIMVEKDRNRLITFIDWCNPVSLKSHIQYGFKIYENRQIWRILGKSFCKIKKENHSTQLIRFLLRN